MATASTLEAETARELLPEDLELLRHALGYDSDGSPRHSEGQRNSFCAGVGHADHRACERLSAAGLMAPGRFINEGRDRYYHATEAGRAAVAALTRAQKRYRAWLAADCGLRFGEWLRSLSASADIQIEREPDARKSPASEKDNKVVCRAGGPYCIFMEAALDAGARGGIRVGQLVKIKTLATRDVITHSALIEGKKQQLTLACCPFCRGELEPLRTEAAAPPSTTEAPPRVDATEHQAEHARELPPDSLSRGERFYAALRQAKDGRALRGSMALWREMSTAFRRAWVAAAEAAAAGQAPADCYAAYLSVRSGVAFDGTAAWAALPDQDAWIVAAAAVAPPPAVSLDTTGQALALVLPLSEDLTAALHSVGVAWNNDTDHPERIKAALQRSQDAAGALVQQLAAFGRQLAALFPEGA